MDHEQKAILKKKIIENIALLKNNLVALKELTKPISPDNAIGRVSRMDAINNKGVNDKAFRQSKMKLIKLNMALEKIENNSQGFGDCKICGKTIQLERLMYMPESSNCIRCAY